MAEGRYIDPRDGRVRRGHLVVVQRMGELTDGKLILAAGQDADVFNIEDGDQFFTAIFAVDPFAQPTAPGGD